MEKLIVGKNFLHSHPNLTPNIDDDHVIIDKKDLEVVQKFFEDYPNQLEKILKKKFVNFYFDSNEYFGYVKSIKKLKKIYNYNQKPGNTQRTPEEFFKFCKQDKNIDNAILNFGTRVEHNGEKSLYEFLLENGIDINKINFEEKPEEAIFDVKDTEQILTGVQLIAKEREEQIEKHGITIEKDFETNKFSQLIDAAIILLMTNRHKCPTPDHWKPELWERMINKSTKERLIISGALIAAQIDLNEYTKQMKLIDALMK